MIFSLSRILGGYPFNDDGLSTKWVLMSTMMRLIDISIVAYRYADNIARISKMSTMDVFIIVRDTIACLPLLFHLHRICFDQHFFSLMKQIQPIHLRTKLVALILLLVFAWDAFSYLNLLYYFGWSPPTQISQFSLLVMTLQYVLFIGVKEKRVSQLRLKLKRDPTAVCVQLDGLSTSVDQMHKIFSTQLLLAVIVVVMNGTFYGFFVMGNVFDFTEHMSVLAVVGISTNLVWLLIILWRCSQFDEQVKAFYAELFRVVWDQNLFSDKKLVLYLLVQRKVKFSACGFFTLGCPLLTSIIGAATTYLVLLIQYNT